MNDQILFDKSQEFIKPGSRKAKWIAPNLLNSEFYVAGQNYRWTIDDTSITNKATKRKIRILFVTDLATKQIITFLATITDFKSTHIRDNAQTQLLVKGIKPQKDPNQRLIIHTDRDTHFTSKTWFDFAEKNKDLLFISMSDSGSPKQNAVSERLNRSAKEMKVPSLKRIYGCSTVKECIENLKEEELKTSLIRKFVAEFQNHYNAVHVHRTTGITPNNLAEIHTVAMPLMDEKPSVVSTRNNNMSPIENRLEVAIYGKKLQEKYAMAIDLENQFGDDPNSQYLLKSIKQYIVSETKKLAALNQAQYVAISSQLNQIEDTLEDLKTRKRKEKEKFLTLPLRGAIFKPTYEALLNMVPKNDKRQTLVHSAQMKITAFVLYNTGARANEIKRLTKEDFDLAPQRGYLPIIETKKSVARNCLLGGKSALEDLKLIKDNLNYLFVKCNFQYLGSTLSRPNDVMADPSWIRAINSYLKELQNDSIHLELKSHSFRIGLVTRLLSKADINKVAKLIGHKSLNTTKAYERYTLDTQENKDLLDDAYDVIGVGGNTEEFLETKSDNKQTDDKQPDND